MNKIKNFNILYIEDDEVTRASISRLLNLYYEDVLMASNGKEALNLYQKYKNTPNSINLIISDINMPIMSGLEMLSVIREEDLNLPVIFITARNESKELLEAIELNISHYILKPVDVDNLITKVKQICNLHFLNTTVENNQKEIRNYIKIIDENIITIRINPNKKIESVSKAFLKSTNYEISDVILKEYIDFLPDEFINIHKEVSKKCLNSEVWHGEIAIIAKNGNKIYLDTKVSPIFEHNNEISSFTLICQDITDKKLIEELSVTDALTGLYNRRHFNEHFPKFINSGKRNHELICFIILDIDYFKQYNDTYGHQLGDSTLMKVSNCIKNSLHRADDTSFRLGGEEFGILFKTNTKENALIFANTIKNSIESLEIEHIKNEVSPFVTVSLGLACDNASNINFNDLFYKKADDLLYKAKENGRNRVETL